MRRRSLLAGIAGGLAALTGCTDTTTPRSGTASPTATPTRRPTADPDPTASPPPSGTATRSAAAEVTVDELGLQYGLVAPASPDSIGIRDPETPYVVASVRVDGTLPLDAFALRVDDESVPPTTPDARSGGDRLYRTSWGDDGWYDANRGRGLLLFEPPSGAAERVRLAWPGGGRTLGDAAGARLAGPPAFSAAVDAPETHAGTGVPSVAVEAANEGERPGRFVGALNRVGPTVAYTPVARLTELVPAGESVRLPVPVGWGWPDDDGRVGDGDPDVTYHLHYPGGEDSASVRLVESDSGGSA
ncbi:hypothetical protein [Candidatus Halobonum tyrrellensis]|uniref:hypothetical protein n=1 Tax=Candidatus Halobonum tyrrellensis TaxID=1431545 RepID=UPI001377A714|nr:hypothetical protein [Candidatus Halobonum tyrrellensis]